jgi:hypothetical protein
MGKEVRFDILQGKIDFVEFMVAGLAIPEEAVPEVQVFPPPFDDQAYRALMPYGGVRDPGRVEVHVSGAEFQGFLLAILLHSNFDKTFKLVKEFFRLVIVVVFSGIRASHYHHDIIISFLVEIFVAYRRF